MALTSTDTKLVSMAQQFSGLPMEDLIAAPLNATAEANAKMALTQTNFILDTCFNTVTTYQTFTETEGADKDKTMYLLKNDQYTENAPTPETSDDYLATTAHQPIMINMTLTRGVISQDEKGQVQVTPVSTRFDLPILTILPINNLGVKNLKIHFEMEVSSSFSEKETIKEENSKKGSFEGGGSAKIGWGIFSAKASFKAKNSYSSKDSTSHDTHYEKKNSAKYSLNLKAGQLPIPDGVKIIIDAFSKSIEPVNVTGKISKDGKKEKVEKPDGVNKRT